MNEANSLTLTSDAETAKAKGSSGAAHGSDSRSKLESTPAGKASLEIWDVLKKHELNNAQVLKIFAGLTKQVGSQIEDEEGAAMTLIQNLTRIIPGLLDKTK